MRNTAIFLMVLTTLSTIIGFIREIILSYFYGASNITDAYIISLTIPQVLISFIGAGISTSFIPLYTKIEKDEGREVAIKFTSNVVNILVTICILITLLSSVFTKDLVNIFASGFTQETMDLAISFTNISIYGMFFSVVGFVFIAYLQLNGNFIATGLMTLPLNVSVIIAIYFSYNLNNLKILSYGSVIAILVQLIFILIFVRNKKYTHSYRINFKDPYLKELLLLVSPVLLSATLYQLNVVVERTVASQISQGGISAISYASRVNAFIFSIFAVSIITAIYPTISKMSAYKNVQDLKKTINKTMLGITILVLPATIGTMVLARPIIVLLYGRGAFGQDAVLMTSSALFFYSIGMLGLSLREMFYRTFYSLQDTKTPMINTGLALIINVVLSVLLARYFGISGLALASSISAIIGTILLMRSLRKKIGSLGSNELIKSYLKIILASIIMGLIVKFTVNIFRELLPSNISLIISILIGVVSYSFLIIFMKIKEADYIVDIIKAKILKLKFLKFYR